MPRPRGVRVPVFVEVTGSIKYGFQASPNSTPYRNALGHTAYTNQAGVFFGANSPKPNRATKTIGAAGQVAAHTVGSFCDSSKIDTLRADNWIITRTGRRRGLKTSGRSRTVYVEMPGDWNYAWNITADDVDLAADLGFAQATAATENLVWGVSYPKPPRASRRMAGANHSSFIRPQASVIDAAIGAGWTVSAIDYDLLPPAAAT